MTPKQNEPSAQDEARKLVEEISGYTDAVTRIAAAIEAAEDRGRALEREACAMLADEEAQHADDFLAEAQNVIEQHSGRLQAMLYRQMARDIRARGKERP